MISLADRTDTAQPGITYSTQAANLFRELGPMVVGDALEIEHHFWEAVADLGVPGPQASQLLLGRIIQRSSGSPLCRGSARPRRRRRSMGHGPGRLGT